MSYLLMEVLVVLDLSAVLVVLDLECSVDGLQVMGRGGDRVPYPLPSPSLADHPHCTPGTQQWGRMQGD